MSTEHLVFSPAPAEIDEGTHEGGLVVDKVYVLSLAGRPVYAHPRFEGASEKMASYTAAQQKHMTITAVLLGED